MKLKERRKKWLQNLSKRTPEERAVQERRNLMRRMSNINIRTFTGDTFVQRNEPCPCGNTYAGGDQPVKFKDCCWSKYAVLQGMTPALAESQKKEQAYFAKNRRLI